MALDDVELVVRQRARLLQDLVRHRELAHVVEQPADRELAKPHRRQPELLADLDRPQRHAAGVLRRVVVLVREPHEQRPNRRAHERIGRAHQLAGAEVAGQRARLRAAVKVERHRHADQPDADQLPPVAEPPAQLGVVHDQARVQRDREQDEPVDHGEVGEAARQEVRAPGAHPERPVEDDPKAEDDPGGGAPGLRHGGHERRLEYAGQPEGQDRDDAGSPEARAPAARRTGAAAPGMAARASTAPPTGSVSAPEKATRPLSPTMKPGVVRPWIDRSAAIDEKAVPISTARAVAAPGARRS